MKKIEAIVRKTKFEDVKEALDAGMNAHVAKPIDMGVLEQTVRAVLEAQEE